MTREYPGLRLLAAWREVQHTRRLFLEPGTPPPVKPPVIPLAPIPNRPPRGKPKGGDA